MAVERLWIGTSFKMNKTVSEAVAFARGLAKVDRWDGIQGFVLPPFTALAAMCQELQGSPVLVGAQNMHWMERGAYTGEVSPPMLKDCGATMVELGHSERRTYFGETDETVHLKVKAALAHGLRPLVCVGETARERECGVTQETLARQIKVAFHAIAPECLAAALIAYEPVWAIGEAGRPAEPEYIAMVHAAIRRLVTDMAPPPVRVPILYGGSVTAQNAPSYVRLGDVDGLFIGRSAWDLDGYLRIVRAVRPNV